MLTTPAALDSRAERLALHDGTDSFGSDARRPALRRWQLMERIMELNVTAREEYLEDFSDDSLARYLEHLESMGSPRGARWVRPGDSPAIMVRETEF